MVVLSEKPLIPIQSAYYQAQGKGVADIHEAAGNRSNLYSTPLQVRLDMNNFLLSFFYIATYDL